MLRLPSKTLRAVGQRDGDADGHVDDHDDDDTEDDADGDVSDETNEEKGSGSDRGHLVLVHRLVPDCIDVYIRLFAYTQVNAIITHKEDISPYIIQTYKYINTHIFIYIYIYTHICIDVYMHMYIHLYI